MSPEEVLAGKHLRHKLRLTNVGRTPAVITKYEINCSWPEGRPTELVTFGLPYLSLAGAASIDFTGGEISVFEYINGTIGLVLFSGSTAYRHVFS
jgi:hypothetical protein